MNVRMDWLAKFGRHKVQEGLIPRTPHSCHPLGFHLVTIRGRIIPDQVDEKLYNYIVDKNLHLRWISKRKYTISDIPKVHWEVLRTGANTQTWSEAKFSAKWSSGFLGIGKQMVKWKLRAGDGCPYCLHPKEDTMHILSCQHQDAVITWEENMKSLFNKIQRWDTDPTLMTALHNVLTEWKYGTFSLNPHNLRSDVKIAIKHIQEISVPIFLEGFIPKSLVAVQESFYRSQQESQKQGKVWAKKLYHANWKFLQGLWTGRNEQLHKTKRIEELQGLPIVQQAIRQEYNLGLHRLPASEFSIYFSLPVEKLLTRSLENIRQWLLTIRLGREFHGGAEHIQDDFSVNGTLRKWLGLPDL